MSTSFRLVASSLLVAIVLAVAVAAQQPHITNARINAQAAGTPFAQSFRSLVSSQPDLSWVGYAVPVSDRERTMCCFSPGSGTTYVSGSVVMSDITPCCGACRLEPGLSKSASIPSSSTSSSTFLPTTQTSGPIKLEGAERMVVLFRIADRKVDRIRVFSEDCELDAGGRTVQWLENVRPADSVALLESFAAPDPDGRTRILDGAITAIALHLGPAADAALDRLIAPAQPDAVRKKVTFWLGNARGRHGFDVLRRVMHDDPSVEVRKSAVFGLSQSKVPETFDTLANAARTDTEARIRSEALFWLAQKGDARASKVIADALEKDPSPEVRKKAIFALTQLKDESAVPSLLQIARSHADPATRGEAIFWLAQTAGKKASDAITERIDQDPDTEVKKRAVFALSQLPKDEGVPLLIKVARTHTNPAVRKQAMFWLGQSKDARALDFFAEILK